MQLDDLTVARLALGTVVLTFSCTPQERIAAYGQVPRLAEAHAGFAAQRDTERDENKGNVACLVPRNGV